MTLSYKFILHPTEEITHKLLEAMDACRWLYNELLEKMNIARDEGRKLSTYETQNLIPGLKAENSRLNRVYSKVLQKVGNLRYKGGTIP